MNHSGTGANDVNANRMERSERTAVERFHFKCHLYNIKQNNCLKQTSWGAPHKEIKGKLELLHKSVTQIHTEEKFNTEYIRKLNSLLADNTSKCRFCFVYFLYPNITPLFITMQPNLFRWILFHHSLCSQTRFPLHITALGMQFLDAF